MLFRKYNSIENTYREKFIEAIARAGFYQAQYVVQEKVHGANFSFLTDGKTVQCAKRTAMLSEEENFYGYQKVRDRLANKVIATFALVKQQHTDLQTLTIFGELFGGNYPHQEVAKIKDAHKVQKGIAYCPHNDFYAFDILLNNEQYLAVDKANDIFEQLDWVYAKTLFQGKLEEALKYPNDFESTIPTYFDLPKIAANICEGTIIKPLEPSFFASGSRVILKNKNEKWSEKIKRAKSNHIATPASTQLQVLQQIAHDYITVNRLNNVLSKVGAITHKDIGKVIGLLAKDTLTDFLKDEEEAFVALEKKEQKMLKKQLTNRSAKLVKEEVLYKL